MAIEIVDLPTKNGDFPQLCKRLPEGKYPVFKPVDGDTSKPDGVLHLFRVFFNRPFDPCFFEDVLDDSSTYCGWKNSCITLDDCNPTNNGMSTIYLSSIHRTVLI